MSISRAQFYARFDVFDLTDYTVVPSVANTRQDAKVDATIAAAEATTDRTLFHNTAYGDEVVMYLTAHLLSQDPTAINMRLQKSRGDDNLYTDEDIYFKTYLRLALGAGAVTVT